MKEVLHINKKIENEKLEKLTELLRRLNTEELTKKLRKEAIELVKNIDPLEISLAEQKLIDDGMNPNELRHLCDIHMEILKDELERLEKSVEKGHVLYTFIKEHEEILKFLDGLESLNKEIQKMKSFDEEKIKKGRALGVSLLNAEPHHKREEEVLFKKLESLEITGPTRVMRLEHEELRMKKRELKELCSVWKYLSLEDFKERFDKISKDIVFELRDHIFKENYILYPTAMDSIKEDEFKKLKEECDMLGYCVFTPKDSI
ncbi:DUF438 domain-containing protein [uncultured Clostridium sp.]|uniref:DUF438 domain-containing protein n=1 Tax=uncultured Clostridium sp. TaxID=59620 RepID=UPI00262CF238|nr:DUF438 domain-containing protein [uncultured Clostridium sp.]